VEALIAACVLGMCIVFYLLAGHFPELVADPGGLALFPRIVAVVTGAASLAFLIQLLVRRQLQARKPARSFGAAGAWIRERRQEILSFALVGALPFGINWLGFIPAIAVFTASLLLVFRVTLIPLVLTTVFTAAGVYAAYALALGAVLPVGRLWN
jgi:putative tricarboxylic transport membrane protein